MFAGDLLWHILPRVRGKKRFEANRSLPVHHSHTDVVFVYVWHQNPRDITERNKIFVSLEIFTR